MHYYPAASPVYRDTKTAGTVRGPALEGVIILLCVRCVCDRLGFHLATPSARLLHALANGGAAAASGRVRYPLFRSLVWRLRRLRPWTVCRPLLLMELVGSALDGW